MIKIVMYFFALGIPLEGPLDVYEGAGACTKVEMEQLVSESMDKKTVFHDVFTNRKGELVGITKPLETRTTGVAFICEEIL